MFDPFRNDSPSDMDEYFDPPLLMMIIMFVFAMIVFGLATYGAIALFRGAC